MFAMTCVSVRKVFHSVVDVSFEATILFLSAGGAATFDIPLLRKGPLPDQRGLEAYSTYGAPMRIGRETSKWSIYDGSFSITVIDSFTYLPSEARKRACNFPLGLTY